MKLRYLALSLILLPSLAFAAGSNYPLDPAPVNLENKASIQRGAKLFVNYCQGCHSAHFQRYNRLARDVGLSDDAVKQHLIFDPEVKVGDTIQRAMSTVYGKESFGAAPPDLSLIARSRGADYIYTYLRTFYVDESRPLGVNNAVFPLVGMPHVMWELQGQQKPVYASADGGHSDSHSGSGGAAGGDDHIVGFEIVEPGSMSPGQFDKAMGDLTNFLVYIAEPIQLERQRLGFWVLLFLAVAFGVFTMLKREYWRDIH